jgi:hypothetical protein
MSDGKHVIKVPIRSIEEYHFKLTRERKSMSGRVTEKAR